MGVELLTNKEVYLNTEMIEKFNQVEDKSLIYGFGVSGKKFVLVKEKDSWIKKIWFSALKFLKFIKVDHQSIQKLKDDTAKLRTFESFKNYQKTHGRVTQEGVKNLIKQCDELEKKIRKSEQQTVLKEQLSENFEKQLKKSENCMQEMENKIVKLEREITVKNATIERINLIIAEKDQMINLFKTNHKKKEEEPKKNDDHHQKQELRESTFLEKKPEEEQEFLEKRVSKLEKKLTDYKRAWKKLSPEKKIKEFLKIEDSPERERKEVKQSH